MEMTWTTLLTVGVLSSAAIVALIVTLEAWAEERQRRKDRDRWLEDALRSDLYVSQCPKCSFTLSGPDQLRVWQDYVEHQKTKHAA